MAYIPTAAFPTERPFTFFSYLFPPIPRGHKHDSGWHWKLGDSLPLKDGGSLGAGGSGHTVVCGFCGPDSAWLSVQNGRLGMGQGCPAGLCREAGHGVGGWGVAC